MTPDVSIVVEWDNVALAGSDRARDVLDRLAGEVRTSRRSVEVLLCHVGEAPPEAAGHDAGLPPGWKTLRAPDSLRYYELKNHGAAAAAGGIVAFLDSDAVPEPGWLEGLLAPFADPAVEVVAGRTRIKPDSLYSKAFALWWFWPLPKAPAPLTPVPHFFANNVAFRRRTIRAHPFAPVPGTSRGACLGLAAALQAAGITIWETSAAQVFHPPPRGWRHFVLRALAQGRDRLARERGWRATPIGSIARLLRFVAAGCVKTALYHRRVDLPLVGVPAAMALCGVYYGLFFAGEAATFLRVPAVGRIRV